MELYQKIRNIREDKDMKQKDLAKHLHMEPNTYNAYENGKREYTAKQLKEICKLFNVSADDLLDLPYHNPLKGLNSENTKLAKNIIKILLIIQDKKKDL